MKVTEKLHCNTRSYQQQMNGENHQTVKKIIKIKYILRPMPTTMSEKMPMAVYVHYFMKSK